MSILSRILIELETPDDQGNDWYGWASNQLSHAFFGALVALFAPLFAVPVAMLIVITKELFDFIRVPTKDTFEDSMQDIAFWGLGAWMFSDPDYKVIATILLSFALVCGIIPRIRKLTSRT